MSLPDESKHYQEIARELKRYWVQKVLYPFLNEYLPPLYFSILKTSLSTTYSYIYLTYNESLYIIQGNI